MKNSPVPQWLIDDRDMTRKEIKQAEDRFAELLQDSDYDGDENLIWLEIWETGVRDLWKNRP